MKSDKLWRFAIFFTMLVTSAGLIMLPIFSHSTVGAAVESEVETTASQNANVAIAKKLFEHFNRHEWEKMAGLYSDPAAFLDPAFGQQVVKQTRRQTAEKYKEMEGMFKDIRDDVVQIYPSGEKNVIVWFVSSGTAPNGTKWTLPICSILTIEKGKITKDLTFYDNPSQK